MSGVERSPVKGSLRAHPVGFSTDICWSGEVFVKTPVMKDAAYRGLPAGELLWWMVNEVVTEALVSIGQLLH